ncbi:MULTISPECIES: EAL domain-containing protein [unclassified Shewanella]|uniref:EAL domain-containing response regulator n=1 Tax=unclassified Shewanella TaxID=196818 RepID=UPI001BBB89A1|nr:MULTISPECIES: EAL domain-containing protein [unclassified Shewanella]GIU15718.1 hypothetical protein TUM4444_27380 [Shewanella sp. MBTL60-112-B1]GIU33616.1 hypothetical protein TUM4445_20960 [Shewanella sp. MBTL60-112-B2]
MNVLIVDNCKYARRTTRAKFSEVFRELDVEFENAENSKSAISSLDNTKRIGLSKVNLLIIDVNIIIEDKFTLMNYMVRVEDYFTPFIIIGSADNWFFEFVGDVASNLKLNLVGTIKSPLTYVEIYNVVTNEFCKLSTNKPVPFLESIYGTTCIKENLNMKKLCLYYQPKVDIKTKKIVGFEVLSRINTNNNQTLYPDDFIPFLEKEKQSYKLTKCVFEKALEHWESEPVLKDYNLSINISADDLRREDFIMDIVNQFEKHRDIDITFELTEYAPIENEFLTDESIKKVIASGIRFSLDDFGKSYSSLKRLDSIPFDEIKIDKTFVSDMDVNHQHQVIVEAIIELGSKLNIKVTAEGVETYLILDMLYNMNCQYVQGYYYSAPLSASELLDWIENYNKNFQ